MAGDAVLKGLSEFLGRQARAIDRVCRYGGEEITIILPEIDLEAATNIAEHLRAAIETQTFDVNTSEPLRITVSIGVASFSAHTDNVQALVAAADAAMYEAKQGGKNRIICYELAPSQAATEGRAE
ncbi:MAG: GGDEF domain-containing protein [Acidiferrobacter sp.]